MLTTLVALGAFLLGVGVTGGVARYYFLLGWEKAHDDRRLEPGAVGSLPSETETTGPIRAVGVSSGRHAKSEWIPPEDMPGQATPFRDEVAAP